MVGLTDSTGKQQHVVPSLQQAVHVARGYRHGPELNSGDIVVGNTTTLKETMQERRDIGFWVEREPTLVNLGRSHYVCLRLSSKNE